MNIVGCAYQRWALKIFDFIKQRSGVEIKIFKTPADVSLENIEPYNPDLVFFYGWDWEVPSEIVGKYPCLCLHSSPLPKYRGGSPLQHQIMNGEIESAVSIFKMNGEVDAGELCVQVPFSLEGNLYEILDQITEIGRFETLRIIREWPELKFWPQEGEPSVFERSEPEESEITKEDLTLGTARYLFNKIRSLQGPCPHAFITCADGQKLYILEVEVENEPDVL